MNEAPGNTGAASGEGWFTASDDSFNESSARFNIGTCFGIEKRPCPR